LNAHHPKSNSMIDPDGAVVAPIRPCTVDSHAQSTPITADITVPWTWHINQLVTSFRVGHSKQSILILNYHEHFEAAGHDVEFTTTFELALECLEVLHLLDLVHSQYSRAVMADDLFVL
jgi:hypothetical protein